MINFKKRNFGDDTRVGSQIIHLIQSSHPKLSLFNLSELPVESSRNFWTYLLID